MPLDRKFNINLIAKNLERMKRDLPPVIGNLGQRFFSDSFTKQGWEDKTLEKWKPRKNKEKGKGRAILVKTEQLRRHVNQSNKLNTWSAITFEVPLPYAAIHNDGGTIHQSARKQVIHIKEFKGGKRKGRKLFAKTDKATYAMKVQTKDRTIMIPPRKFMGTSTALNRMISQTIVRYLMKMK